MASNRMVQTLFERAKNDDDSSALKRLRILANKNPPNKEALTLLGTCYYFGYGCSRDYKLAYLVYEEAADLGCDMAMYRLGRMFQYGLGGEPDFEMAADWYYQSAKNISPKNVLINHSVSQLEKLAKKNPNPIIFNRLGNIFEWGYGTSQDFSKAIKLYAKAAEQGCDAGMYNLGRAYQYGLGVEKDLSIAMYWFRESIKSCEDENKNLNPSKKRIKEIKHEIQNNKIIKQSNYDDQIVIDLRSEGAFFSDTALTRVRKWNVNNAKLCYLIRGDDLLEKSDQVHFPKNSQHLRIYIVGHCWIGLNYLHFEDQEKRIRFNKLARFLAGYIGDQTTTISLMTCFGGKGFEKNSEDSFGAKLHLELVKLLKRDVPVIARISYSSANFDTNQQTTFDLHELEKYKEDYALSVDVALDTSNFNLYKHHQPNSKVIFMLENNRQVKYDAYNGIHLQKKKWKEEALKKIQELQKTTLVHSKRNFLKGLLDKFDKMSADDMYFSLQKVMKKEKSPIKNHSSDALKFFSIFFKIRTNTEEKMGNMIDDFKSRFDLVGNHKGF